MSTDSRTDAGHGLACLSPLARFAASLGRATPWAGACLADSNGQGLASETQASQLSHVFHPQAGPGPLPKPSEEADRLFQLFLESQEMLCFESRIGDIQVHGPKRPGCGPCP